MGSGGEKAGRATLFLSDAFRKGFGQKGFLPEVYLRGRMPAGIKGLLRARLRATNAGNAPSSLALKR